MKNRFTKLSWTITAVILQFSACSSPQPNLTKLASLETPKIIFSVHEGILHPESALYSDAEKAIFVSNIASGNPLSEKRDAFISKLSIDGKMINLKWADNLKAPKGLGIYKNFLYVSDVNQIVKINLKTGKTLETKNLPQAQFLNDIAINSLGEVFISDMLDNTIYIWNKAGVSVYLKSNDLKSPNGLIFDDNEQLMVAQWGSNINAKDFSTQTPGSIAVISNSGIVQNLAGLNLLGHFDGIDKDLKGNLWVSDWMNGDVYQISNNNNSLKVFNFGPGTADISIIKEKRILLVPQMKENKVLAIQL